MHDLALYRKYRPKKFKEVLGQNHIVDVLESSVETNKVSHAYLFVGSRGTGKTSVARIFATSIGVSINDMYEIDAASNRGIEDIKELRDGARVLPFDSKYKVYIIDEVHMLSKDAWGALLKTLEEPPKHVIFILATTEMQKVPETIISRCQVFVFKKATDTVNKKMLIDVAKKEGFELDAGSAELLAILADGSFRDALGELQKVVNFSKGKKIKIEDVEKITGAPKTVLVNNFISAIAEKNLEKGIGVVQKASAENLDMKLFLKLIVSKLRLAIILRYAPKLKNEMVGDLSEADIEFLQNVVKTDKEGMLRSGALAILLEAYQNIDNAFIAELPLELALVKILGKE
ncbi:DNA polymerase III, subunit gamma and tau [Candidatus Nomurabacteria bacterium RIFCSPLOWO2_02_40_28]|uniref:DNA polymerase III subunit gamma/tau n=2 Tax=Candidatus Nomuraibacteriota TaxID=1752729 RepID=A0A837HX18_9BACT|nr:MAG: polymerase III, subunit gamma and tau protein [Candidatus Nomurabacteria bacterium GW2011_GWD2_39_12]KKR20982.1 MAG: polymerase III, subunit gamma and tau protein [Candidatus Nomurabacteria bacterium GW2011_GWC2_39_41]KKR36984.1 MAG: polymerase III, subunit gamma and tau protein [Candidatus Nomurabacteria bacterium GW2011_GWE2_40_10]KKR38931.1 MAG: polymerase III, subunit gamma and tau protein [Candidatus Nomurabacteria bacterium GW2011_GWB1_40_11]KKR40173.1 MAG: polymerase III, subunit